MLLTEPGEKGSTLAEICDLRELHLLPSEKNVDFCRKLNLIGAILRSLL